MDFSRSVARVVAAQIAEATGFDACQDSAVEILADLLLRYLSTLCSSGHAYAELAGRSQSNLADVMLALEDLGVTPEDLHHHMQLQASDVPFAHTLVNFPVHSQPALPPTFVDRREPHAGHIPGFLPAFPDPHTYQHTAAYAGHTTDPHKQRQATLQNKQKAEAALNKLHQRMSSRLAKTAAPHTNAFLAAPAVETLPALPSAATPPPAAAAGADAAAAAAAAAAGSGSQQQQQPSQAQLQPQPVPVPVLAAPVIAAAAAAAGGGGGGAGDAADEEDALFESAAVLKAFSAVLPLRVLAEQQARVLGATADEAEQQAAAATFSRHQQKRRQRQGGGIIEDGGDEPGAAAAGAGGGGMMDVDEEEEAAAGGGAGADEDEAAALQGQWIGWKAAAAAAAAGGGGGDAPPSSLLGPAGEAGPLLLAFGVDPLAGGKAAALALAGRARPADAYAERLASGKGRPGGGSGSRQRRSKYDVDPALRQAEGILAAAPETMFGAVAAPAAAGAGAGGAERLHEVYIDLPEGDE